MDAHGGAVLSFRVLGPLEVTVHGRPVAITAGKLRVLLASLLLRPNQIVSVDQLAEWLWDGDAIANPRAALHTYVRRLREALDVPDLLETAPHGYRIRLDAASLD